MSISFGFRVHPYSEHPILPNKHDDRPYSERRETVLRATVRISCGVGGELIDEKGNVLRAGDAQRGMKQSLEESRSWRGARVVYEFVLVQNNDLRVHF